MGSNVALKVCKLLKILLTQRALEAVWAHYRRGPSGPVSWHRPPPEEFLTWAVADSLLANPLRQKGHWFVTTARETSQKYWWARRWWANRPLWLEKIAVQGLLLLSMCPRSHSSAGCPLSSGSSSRWLGFLP